MNTLLAEQPQAGARIAGVGRPRLGPVDRYSVAGQFALHLEHLMEERGLSPKELSARCHAAGLPISDAAIQYYLRGKSTPPLPDLLPLSKALRLKRWQDLIPPARRRPSP